MVKGGKQVKMNELNKFILSKDMAWLILAVFALIIAAAVTLKMQDDSQISNTYTGQMRELEWNNIQEKQEQPNIEKTTLATSQETNQLCENKEFITAVHISDNMVISNSGSSNPGSSEIKIPCAWAPVSVSLSDFKLICTTVYCEAGDQSIETQIMTALTILNRLTDDDYPNTVREVIYQSEQYSVTQWTDFEKYGWTTSVEQAVTYALEVNEYPKDMFFFRTEHYHEFGQPYKVSDDLYFSTAN